MEEAFYEILTKASGPNNEMVRSSSEKTSTKKMMRRLYGNLVNSRAIPVAPVCHGALVSALINKGISNYALPDIDIKTTNLGYVLPTQSHYREPQQLWF
jgi:hypothetical protein